MNKILKIVFAVITLLVNGCGAGDTCDTTCDTCDTERPRKGREVVFRSEVAAPVSRMEDDAWESGDKIGIYMTGADGSIRGEAESNVMFVVSGDGGNGDDGNGGGGDDSGDGSGGSGGNGNGNGNGNGGAVSFAAGEKRLFFPDDGSAVNFSAYYPYHAEISENHTFTVDISNQQDRAAIDILWAKADAGGEGYDKTTATAIPLEFSHKMSTLSITIVRGAGMADVDLSQLSVRLEAMPMTAGFSIPDGEFRQIYTYGDFNAVPIVSGSIYGAILIPCRSMAETQGVFSLGDKRFIWKIPSGTEFRSGWRHPWTITLNDSEAPGESGIAIGEISINDWNGAGNAPIEGATREP